jgi:hypothetical protein
MAVSAVHGEAERGQEDRLETGPVECFYWFR